MKSILFAIFSGLLLIICFPKFDLGFLAWFAMVPLFIAIKGKNLKSTFSLCFLAGMIFYPSIFYWFKIIKGVSWFDYIFCVSYLSSCYFGFFGLGLNFISKRTKLTPIIIAPLIWVCLEYIRSYASFLQFPWMLMGHSQYLNLPIIQISAFTGVYGVSFLIVMVNVVISEIILNRSISVKTIIVTVVIIGTSLVYGLSITKRSSGSDTARVTVIQGNIPRDIKWKREFAQRNLEKHVRLTKNAISNSETSLIVWPEAAIESFRNNYSLSQKISTLARETGTHLLFGSSQHPKSGSREFRKEKKLNSAFLISPEGKIEGQYNKIHLVPFIEYLPYKGFLPWPSKYVSGSGNFIPGKEYTIFEYKEARFGALICWENLYPEHFRQFVKRGANCMINITNESWFEDTSAPYQIRAMNVFRAVENCISVVRCANTGISCFINSEGKIMGEVKDHNNKKTFVEGYLTGEVPLSYKKTFYTMYGDVFIYMNLIMTAFMLALCFFNNKYSVDK